MYKSRIKVGCMIFIWHDGPIILSIRDWSFAKWYPTDLGKVTLFSCNKQFLCLLYGKSAFAVSNNSFLKNILHLSYACISIQGKVNVWEIGWVSNILFQDTKQKWQEVFHEFVFLTKVSKVAGKTTSFSSQNFVISHFSFYMTN